MPTFCHRPQNVSTAALFLAAKIEEQPRKLEHMAKVFHSLHNREGSDLDVSSPVSSQ
jgi:cyclin T